LAQLHAELLGELHQLLACPVHELGVSDGEFGQRSQMYAGNGGVTIAW
jgi:hypothetical protein